MLLRTNINYYPFGSPMSERTFNSPEYKYGFNGKEKDDETSTAGGSYDFGARMYDSRLGRWLAVDPFVLKYPNMSPYNYVGNMPIIAIDPDGKVIKIVSTDPVFRAKAFALIQKLTDTKLVLLKNGIVIEAHKVKDVAPDKIEITGAPIINKGCPKAFGGELVGDLIETSKPVKIVPLKGSKFERRGNCTNEDNANAYDNTVGDPLVTGDGSGSGSTVYFDVDGKGENIKNADGTKGRKAQCGLGHEFGHARYMANGKKNGNPTTVVDPDSKSGTLLPNVDEINVREKVDSKIRDEQGDQQRAPLNKEVKK